MFLSNYSFGQREAFLGFAQKLLHIDGDFDAEEQAYLRNLCAEMSLSQSDGKVIDITELPKMFSTEEEQRLFMVEIIALAWANHDYDEKEKALIDSVAKVFKIDESKMIQIEDLMKQYFKTQKSIINFISKEKEV